MIPRRVAVAATFASVPADTRHARLRQVEIDIQADGTPRLAAR